MSNKPPAPSYITTPNDLVEIVTTPTKSVTGYNQQIGRKNRTPLKDFRVKNLTRSDLEAIGQNWLDRRNKLLDYAQKIETPVAKSFRAWDLAHILNERITKIAIILGMPQEPKQFKSGGVVSSIESLKPGERVISKPNLKNQ